MRLLRMFLITCMLMTAPVTHAGSKCPTWDCGWFFYDDPEPDPVPEPPPEPEPPVAAAPPAPEPADVEEKGPPALSAAWLQANLESYLHAAMDNPTEDNVAAYLYLQRLSMDKSSRFTDAAQRVYYTDPHLNEESRRPLAYFASSKMSKAARDAVSAVMTELGAYSTLYYVFSDGCPTCGSDAPALASFSRRYGFRMVSVSLDGTPPPQQIPFAERLGPGAARVLGAESAPELYVQLGEAAPTLLSNAALSQEGMSKRLLHLAHAEGYITDEQFSATRAFRDVQVDIQPSDVPEELTQDPAALVEYMRERFVEY